MNNFEFYPYGTKSITISFECDKCENIVESEEIFVPEPDYTAEKMSDGQRMEEGYAICSECNKEFNIEILSNGYGTINDLSENIQVSVVEEDSNEFYDEEELLWEINSTEQLKIYKNHIKSIKEILLNHDLSKEIEFSLLVMLHSHIIASIELFLSSTFIHTVTNSEEFIKKLIETDPELGKKTLTLKEIYEEQKKLKITVASYLKELIFHKLDKVKPMYKSVLDIDFGDIKWLFKAVKKRHDCTHRAGYDIDGDKISISPESINKLIEECEELTKKISQDIIYLEQNNPKE